MRKKKMRKKNDTKIHFANDNPNIRKTEFYTLALS